MMSLQEQCVDIIINNFYRYHLAYSTIEDKSEKIKYEFLRRKYSFELAVKLHEKYEFRTDYIDFVLNKFLKTLDTCWLQNFNWENISKKLTEIGPSLEKVIFNDSEHPWSEIVCHLPNLLYASFCECNDLYLKLISEFCPKIRSIDCNSCNFTKDGVKHICSQKNGQYPCPDLKEIIIASVNFSDDDHSTDEAIGYLIKSLPYLENVDYQNLPLVIHSIHKDDLDALDKIKPYNLTNLQLIDLNPASKIFDDTLKICVSLCSNLNKFSSPVGNENHLNLCSQLSKLQDAHLSNVHEYPMDLDNFLELRGSLLTSLKISYFSLHVSSVLKNCKKLHKLHLDKVTFLDDESDAEVIMSNLKDLTFKNFILIDAVTNKALESVLSSSPNLELLSIKSCELYSSTLKTAIIKCSELNKLKIISFKSSVVDAKFVRDVLMTCTSLTTLNLEHSDLSNNNGEEDIEIMLESLAETLPNQPLVLLNDGHISDFSDYEHFVNEYDDYYDTDEDDVDYDFSDYDYDLEEDYYNDFFD